MPVVTISRDSCPTSCPLLGNGCYASAGPLKIHWDRVTDASYKLSLEALCQKIARFPKRQIWRYGQAGDLPGVGDEIDHDSLMALVKANRGRPVIAYTHKPPTQQNLDALRTARDQGFNINLSANNVEHADELCKTGLNVVTILPEEYGRKRKGETWMESLTQYRERLRSLPRKTPGGRRIAVCPEAYMDVRCFECGACARTDSRRAVIGFPAHGYRRKHLGRVGVMSKELSNGAVQNYERTS